MTFVPTVAALHASGWAEGQIQYQPEWRAPRTPSHASRREAGHSFDGYPADIVIFDSEDTSGEWEHLLILFELKAPNRMEGRNQLEILLSLEPRARLGFWTNGTDMPTRSSAAPSHPCGNVGQRCHRPAATTHRQLILQSSCRHLSTPSLRPTIARSPLAALRDCTSAGTVGDRSNLDGNDASAPAGRRSTSIGTEPTVCRTKRVGSNVTSVPATTSRSGGISARPYRH